MRITAKGILEKQAEKCLEELMGRMWFRVFPEEGWAKDVLIRRMLCAHSKLKRQEARRLRKT